MKAHRFGLALACILATSEAGQADWNGSKTYQACIDAAGGVDFNFAECASAELEREDKRLNGNYAKALKAADDKVKNAIKASQRAWITFRDLTCQTQGTVYDGGTFERVAYAECKARLTSERADWLDGVHP